jgi:hypothetical protein
MVSKSEFDINVLHEVAARPILWDSRTDNYKESDKKPPLWLEIADKLRSSLRFFSIVNGTYSSYNCYPHQTTQGNNVFVSHLERIGVASFFTAGLIGRPKQAGGDSLQDFPAGMPAGKTC